MLRTRTRSRGGGISNPTLSRIIPGVNFQIDATLAASYPGTGQDYLNLINVPADGTSKAGYDFFLGTDGTVSTDDPTFTGTAGTKSAYFLHDGGDDHRLKANTTFLNDFVRTDQSGSVYIIATFQVGTLGAQQLVCGTGSSSSVVGGFRIEISGSNFLRLQRTDGASVNSTTMTSGILAATDYLVIMVYDKAAQSIKYAVNSRTFSTVATVALPNLVSNTSAFKLAGAGSGALRLSANSRTYGLAGGAGDLSNAQASAIVDYYNNLHGRTYA